MNNDKNEDLKKKNNILTKISGAFRIVAKISFVSFVVLIIAIAFSLLYSRIKGQSPSVAGYKLYVVVSKSMSPTIDIGSIVFIKQTDCASLRKGDVITFRIGTNSNETITHRIQEVKQESTLSFVTKGDANNDIDEKIVYENDIIGKVVYHIPYIGRLLNFIKTKWGIVLFIVIPSLFVGIAELVKFVGLVKGKDRIKNAS